MHQKHQNRTIKTTTSQQYTSFVFSFAKTRSVDVTSVDQENGRPTRTKSSNPQVNSHTSDLRSLLEICLKAITVIQKH